MAILFQFGELKEDSEDGNKPFAQVPSTCPLDNSLFVTHSNYHSVVNFTNNYLNIVFSGQEKEGILYGKIDEFFLEKLQLLTRWPMTETQRNNIGFSDFEEFLKVARWCADNLDNPYWVAMP